ncbi:MAG: restriction endonuclease subunit S, partial [Verrucomicrobiia bacterium]
ADPKKVYPKYLFALLRSPTVQAQIGNMHVGTLIPHFKKGDFNKLLLPVPDKKTQENIGNIYFELSAKIELNRRMNATLEAMARALFQCWFVDFDPVRAKLDGRQPAGLDQATAAFPDGFYETKLGHIPRGWQVGLLGDLCNLKRGHDLPTSKRTAGAIPVISSSGISGTHSETNVRGPGVITGRYGTIGKVFFVETDYWPLNTTLYVEDFKGNPPRFIFHALGEVDYSNYTDKAAVPGVNRNHLHEEPTVIPPMDIRHTFACIVAPLWKQHASNERQSHTLATLRDTLLPKLLSGEVRACDVKDNQ